MTFFFDAMTRVVLLFQTNKKYSDKLYGNLIEEDTFKQPLCEEGLQKINSIAV